MIWSQAVLLGLIQGLTEFWPISSSGHLVLFPLLFDFLPQPLAFDLILHLGTVTALLIYFYKDIYSIVFAFSEALVKHKYKVVNYSKPAKLGLYLLLSSIPAGLLGFFLDDFIEEAFRSIGSVAYILLAGSFLMLIAELFYASRKKQNVQLVESEMFSHGSRSSTNTANTVNSTNSTNTTNTTNTVNSTNSTNTASTTNTADSQDIKKPVVTESVPLSDEISLGKALGIGLLQSLALFPGMSRSGSTISGGMLFGLSRENSARFSFLMSIPIILGASIFKISSDLSSMLSTVGATHLLLGYASSSIIGIFAIKILLRYVRNNSLYIFIFYRILLSLVLILFFVY